MIACVQHVIACVHPDIRRFGGGARETRCKWSDWSDVTHQSLHIGLDTEMALHSLFSPRFFFCSLHFFAAIPRNWIISFLFPFFFQFQLDPPFMGCCFFNPLMHCLVVLFCFDLGSSGLPDC